jgi:hypothetical protein
VAYIGVRASEQGLVPPYIRILKEGGNTMKIISVMYIGATGKRKMIKKTLYYVREFNEWMEKDDYDAAQELLAETE